MRRAHLARTSCSLLLASLALAASRPAPAQERWKRPPQEILDVLNAPEPPVAWLDPTGRVLVLAQRVTYPPIEELAAPMLRLAGVRVNPATNSLHAETTFESVTFVTVADGSSVRVDLPSGARVRDIVISPDGRRFAVGLRGPDGLDLAMGDTATGALRRVGGARLNPILGQALAWMPGSGALLAKLVPPGRGPAPARPLRPEGPETQETAGASAASTYEARDVLASAHDEALFEYHGRSQLAVIDAVSLAVTPLGAPDILAGIDPSPDGSLILVDRIGRPFSHRVAWWRFPTNVEAWDASGRVVHVLARRPLTESVPIQGVPEGPRDHAWRPTRPATVTWVEALDGGDWARRVPHRDRVLSLAAPFTDEPREIHRAAHRITGLAWGEADDLLLVDEYERERRWRHAWALRPDTPGVAPREIVSLSANDGYADPGSPVMRTLESGHAAIVQDRGAIFMVGDGSSPAGDRPFLDRFSLATLRSERLFRSAQDAYERVVGVVDARAGTCVTRRESPKEVPNYHVRTLGGRVAGKVPSGEPMRSSRSRALTSFVDPAPVVGGISKRIVTFTRKDGVPLSFTLYLPPGWTEGTRLPTIVVAYPLEYSDPGTAGQITGTDRTFTRLSGASPLFLLLSGYAVLAGTTMPVIGDPETAYDTFIEQLVLSAEAAVAKAVEVGVADPDRIGVTGHSHGGLMTATLLAHSDLFRAGVARSGAYNHTIRPFGFQSERRTYWQAPETYVRLSPTLHAPEIDEPILIVHGAADQNPGTVPLQSEKLYEAVRGTGGTARLVMLPHELHGYSSREGVEQLLAEQLEWFDRFVKNAPLRAPSAAGAELR